ncbi:DUF5011 domain-containing protein [Akkermansiaceae bacterium]|nr:DUF5011 domain-containing protein [Akkermansiaceae bacterium]
MSAEYYLGADPGEGNGVPLSLSDATSVSAGFNSVDISLVGLEPGTYDVGVRVKDDQDRWSNPVIKRFTLAAGDFELAGGLDRTGDANQGVTIGQGPGGFGGGVSGEYFVGDDPGEGNGVKLSLSEGSSLSAAFEAAEISLTDLDPGTYDVGVRVKDDQDRWSNAVIKRFTLAPGDFELAGGLDRTGDANQGVTIGEGPGGFGGGVVAEYFLGDDPGEGNGVELSLSEGSSLSAAFEAAEISLTDLDPGTYDVGVRVKDDQDRWSNAVIKRFTLHSAELVQATEESVSNGSTPSLLPPARQSWLLSLFPSSPSLESTITVGDFESVYERGIEETEKSFVFRVLSDLQADPRFADLVSFAASGTLGIEIQMLETGRVSEDFVGAVGEMVSTVSASGRLGTSEGKISAAEYFVGTDPGAGQGEAIESVEILADGNQATTSSFTVPLENLRAGTHRVGVRFKNAAGIWGEPVFRSFTSFDLTGSADQVLPVITLVGKTDYQIFIGEEYSEPGYSASDDVDGDLSSAVRVTGSVNTAWAGIQPVTYEVRDSAGNMTRVVRQVEVLQTRVLTTLAAQNGSITGGGVYEINTNAILRGIPDTGYVFGSWTGDASGEESPLTFPMAEDAEVGAVFTKDLRDPDGDGLSNYDELLVYQTDPNVADSDNDGYNDGLEVSEGADPNVIGSYPTRTLTVLETEFGSVTGEGVYSLGRTVELTATPDAGYVFSEWTEDAEGNDNSLSLVMTSSITVGALFIPDEEDSDGDGLTNYQEFVVFGTNAEDADSDDDGYTDGLEIDEGSNPNIDSSFPTRVLTLSQSQNGSIAGIGLVDGGSKIYPLGTSATLTATPGTAYVFEGWSGSASGSENPLTVTMNSDATLGAVFARDLRDQDGDGLTNYDELLVHGTDYRVSDSDEDGYDDGVEIGEGTDPNNTTSIPRRRLSVAAPENGSVSGAGIYPFGDEVILTATPDVGYIFGGWIGDLNSSQNPLSFSISENQSVEAIFSRDLRDSDEDGLSNYEELLLYGTNPDNADSDNDGYNDALELGEGTDPNDLLSLPTRALVVLDARNGSVLGAGVYALGEEVGLVVTPELGYLFTGWIGDASGTENPLTVTMTTNLTVGATFERDLRDSDDDGLTNYEELVVLETDPLDEDSDDDGYNDGLENTELTNPKDSANFPTREFLLLPFTNGLVSGSGGYPLGAEAVITATPDTGYVFAGWDSGLSGNPLRLVMDKSWAATPRFVQDSRDPDEDGLSNYEELVELDTDPNDPDSDDDGYNDGLENSEGTNPNSAGSYPTRTLSLDATENGSLFGDGVYKLNNSVDVVASPNPGFVLGSWTGDATGSENPLSLLMADDYTIGATFLEDDRDPDGDGLTNYQELVVLKTNPNKSDSDDDGYDDGQEVEEGSNPILSDSYPTRTLTVSDVVNGSVSGGGVYALGVQATLTATPDLGHLFVKWSGSASGAQSSIVITMDSDASVGAEFERDEADPDSDGLTNYQELVVTNTNPQNSDSDNDGYFDGVEVGEGTNPNSDQSLPTRVLTIVDPENGRATGSGTYQLGATATLSATPDTGYLFGSWTGDITSSTNPLTITMTENQSVGVRFDQDSRDPDQDGLSNYEELLLYDTDPNDPDSDDDGYNDGLEQSEGTNPKSLASYPTRTLTLVTAENGNVFGAGVYRLNEVATVVASADRGYVLSGWSDGASGAENPLAVAMTQDIVIAVTFARDGRDPDSDGLTNYEELIVHQTNPNGSDTDSDGFMDGLEVTEGSDPLNKDSFPTRRLTTSDFSNGSISGAGIYPLASEVSIWATADRGYVFSRWTGGVTGSVNPTTQTLLQNLTVGAVFEKDVRDSDQDGVTNYDELIVYDTDPLNPDTDGDGFNDGFEIANNTDLKVSTSSPPMDLQIKMTKTDDFLFGVFTITPPVGGIIAIEETRDLKTWTQIDSFVGTGAPFTRTVLPTGKGVYYRLRLIDQSQ